MKNLNKALTLLASLAILAGCSSTPTISDANNTIVEQDPSIVQNTYQDIFDSIFEKQGVEIATNELLLRVAKQVLADSDNWTAESIQAALTKKINNQFNSFAKSGSYFVNGLFSEEKLVHSLRTQGHNIKSTTAVPFKESVTNLIGHKDLKTLLTQDYSEYVSELENQFYLELLNEEYILSQRAGTVNTSYFKNKQVRKVQYFKYTPSNSADANKFAEKFQTMVDVAIQQGKSLKEIATEANGLEHEWKLYQLENLAKEFAMINTIAHEGHAVNEDPKYPLPAEFASSVAAFEQDYENDSVHGYRDVYNHKEDYDADKIAEVKTKNVSYSDGGKKSIYEGYYQKQLEIIRSTMFTELVSTTDGTDVISSTVQDKIEDMDSFYKESKYIDVYETGSAVFKSGDSYYIVYAEKVEDSSSLDLRKEGAEALATVSSNVRNAIYYYLTSLTEAGKLEVTNQAIYDKLNSTYNYGEEK